MLRTAMGRITTELAVISSLMVPVVAQGNDVTNANIHVLINSNTTTIVSFSGDGQGQTNVCLSTDPAHKDQTDRIYSFLLAHYMADKNLARISYDPSQIVSGCGYKLLTEAR